MVHLLAWAAHSPSSCSSTLPEVGPLRVGTGTSTRASRRPATPIHLGHGSNILMTFAFL